MIDFDHNATTPMRAEVVATLRQLLERAAAQGWGNPSSVHARGRAARDEIETARRRVAAALGAEPLEVTFTAGGTEADALAICGSVRARRAAGQPCGVLTSGLEHPAVLGAVSAMAREGASVQHVRPDGQGRIHPDAVTAALREAPEVGVVSLMAAQHELGNRYDVPGFVAAVRQVRPDVLVHTDAVQAFGKIDVDFGGWGVDLLSVSAHKIGGPAGAGALVHRRHASLSPSIPGHQERGRRGGTEALLAVVGFGVACAHLRAEVPARFEHCDRLRARLRAGLEALGGEILGDPEQHIGNTLNVGFEGCDGELMCINLDLEGIAVSTGAACSAGTLEPSPVLAAIGAPPARARQAIRLSLGPSNDEAEVDAVLAVLPPVIERVRAAGEALR